MARGRTGSNRARSSAAAAVALATLGATAVGCTSSDPLPVAESPTTTAAPATPPPTTQDEAADEELAEDALLTTAEVPGGPWTEGDDRSASSSSSGLDCEAMTDESEYFDENAKGAPGAKAPELTDEATGAELQLDVNIVATDEVAETVAGFFGDERFAGCLEEQLLETASTGSSSATITDSTVEPLAIAAVGDSASAWSATFTVEQGSQVIEVSGVIAFVQVGRGFANVSLVAGAPVGASEVDPILDAAADKLESVLG